MKDYIIVGDTTKYKECLVCVCGDLDNANKVLKRILNNPTYNDEVMIEGYSNLRIKEVPEKNC